MNAKLWLFLAFLPVSALAVDFGGSSPKTGFGTLLAGTDDYRLGDEWGKRPVSDESLKSARPAFRRAALATAQTGGATGFFLGKFDGAYVMATNHHVFPRDFSCLGNTIRFPLLGVMATCEKFLGTWPEIDLALFTIKVVNPADGAKLESVAANFQFRENVRPGQKLLTIGFGVAGNNGRQVMANEDSDCSVFSKEGDYRLMADPDRWNPGSYRAWSFALGCDVSHGDSGSAIVDRESGRVVGIIWTGRIPKNPAVQSSQTLAQLFRSGDEMIWQELSYAVPAPKIKEVLERVVSGSLPEESRRILQALIK